MSKSEHFTAVVEINKTSISTESGSYGKPDEVNRQVAEVAKLVIRADTLDKLTDKIAVHVDLIEA